MSVAAKGVSEQPSKLRLSCRNVLFFCCNRFDHSLEHSKRQVDLCWFDETLVRWQRFSVVFGTSQIDEIDLRFSVDCIWSRPNFSVDAKAPNRMRTARFFVQRSLKQLIENARNTDCYIPLLLSVFFSRAKIASGSRRRSWLLILLTPRLR